jgi:hypothetical protein
MTYAYEWCAEGQEAFLGRLDTFDVDSRKNGLIRSGTGRRGSFPTWTGRTNTNAGQEEPSGTERPGNDFKAVRDSRTPPGHLFYESHTKPVAWGEAHLKMLTVLTNLLSDTF